jgi:hypothetical protein
MTLKQLKETARVFDLKTLQDKAFMASRLTIHQKRIDTGPGIDKEQHRNELNDYTIPQLKAMLTYYHMKTTGNKKDLVRMLIELPMAKIDLPGKMPKSTNKPDTIKPETIKAMEDVTRLKKSIQDRIASVMALRDKFNKISESINANKLNKKKDLKTSPVLIQKEETVKSMPDRFTNKRIGLIRLIEKVAEDPARYQSDLPIIANVVNQLEKLATTSSDRRSIKRFRLILKKLLVVVPLEEAMPSMEPTSKGIVIKRPPSKKLRMVETLVESLPSVVPTSKSIGIKQSTPQPYKKIRMVVPLEESMPSMETTSKGIVINRPPPPSNKPKKKRILTNTPSNKFELYYKTLENALEKYKKKPDEFKTIYSKFKKLTNRALDLATTPEQYRRVQTGISNTADNIFFGSNMPGEILGVLPDRLQYPLYKGPMPPQDTFNIATFRKFAKDNNITLPEYIPGRNSNPNATPRTKKRSKDFNYPGVIKLFLDKWFKTQAQKTYMEAYPDKAEAYKKQLEFNELTKQLEGLIGSVKNKTDYLDKSLILSKDTEPSNDDLMEMVSTIITITSNLTLIDVILRDWTSKNKVPYPGIPNTDDFINRIEKLKDLLFRFIQYRKRSSKSRKRTGKSGPLFREFVERITKTADSKEVTKYSAPVNVKLQFSKPTFEGAYRLLEKSIAQTPKTASSIREHLDKYNILLKLAVTDEQRERLLKLKNLIPLNKKI